jgi:hypothetical protein
MVMRSGDGGRGQEMVMRSGGGGRKMVTRERRWKQGDSNSHGVHGEEGKGDVKSAKIERRMEREGRGKSTRTY